MEMCLSGRLIGAEEAERSGLVARVVPVDELLDEALKVAALIASKSLPVLMPTRMPMRMLTPMPMPMPMPILILSPPTIWQQPKLRSNRSQRLLSWPKCVPLCSWGSAG